MTILTARGAATVSAKNRPSEPIWSKAVKAVQDYRRGLNERAALLALDDAALKDIGLTRAEVERLANLPVSAWTRRTR
ncbi:MAG: DUF1127 domain-containing protein [Hyphomicrobiales bacterium]|nr:DUF1127 domain-containing protein [Hyphomicrobiales bacterium]